MAVLGKITGDRTTVVSSRYARWDIPSKPKPEALRVPMQEQPVLPYGLQAVERLRKHRRSSLLLVKDLLKP